MDKYIKQEAAIAIIEEKQKELCPIGRYGRGYVYGSDREKYDAWDEIIDALENIPAADVAPVVRCEKCEYVRAKVNRHTGEQVGVWCCLWDEIDISADDYCSRGKPKEGAHADDYD